MANDLEQALSNKLSDNVSDDELTKAMSLLLVILLERLGYEKEDDFATELADRIKNKYPKYSGLANKLIPKPM